jgi:hypothetical protein
MSKQTAVQILVESMTTSDVSFYSKEIAIALQMEREQIVEACNSQKNDYRGMPTYNKSGEQYYNETYGGQDE